MSKPGFAMTYNASAANAMFDRDAEAFLASARPAAQAMAQVMVDEVRSNVSRLRKYTGKLAASIYQAYSKDNSGPGLATYHVSWNASKAPHAHLVEFGHWQRYAVYLGDDGQLHLMVRPEAQGKPKPRRNASQAEKNAYYVPLDTPKWVPGRSFFRKAISKTETAYKAGADRFHLELAQRGVVR